MAAAARLDDPIGHSPAMNWLLAGLLAGAAIAVIGVAVIGTGGLAAVAIVGGAAAGGAGLGEVMSSMSWAPKEEVGVIVAIGASKVFTNNRPAARAHLDYATCSKHPDPATIATGSGTVYINGMPAARVDDKTICSATITKGSGNVYIGGPTVQTDEISPENLVPEWVHVTLLVVGVGSTLVLAAPLVVVGGLLLGTAGGMGGSALGGYLFGEGSDGQKWMALGGGFAGGMLGPKGGSPLALSRVPKPPPVVPKLSPGALLRQKYGHLSPQDRKNIINQRLEAIASDRLATLEQSIQNAHFQGRHGAQTTLAQQRNRAVHGVDPITNQVRYKPNGDPMRPNSTRFLSARDQINSIERASTIYNRTGTKLFAETPIKFRYQAGEGYYGGTSNYDTAFSVQVWFNQAGKPITAFPILGK